MQSWERPLFEDHKGKLLNNTLLKLHTYIRVYMRELRIYKMHEYIFDNILYNII